VGVDPHGSMLERWGLSDDLAGLHGFCQTAVEAFADRVAVLKPQSAFFERFGSAGIAELESLIRHSRAAGALVLLDVKRGDIGSTSQAYAQAYLAPGSPLYADAITVSPYLGLGALTPIFEQAGTHGGGVFVLARTSNPDGRVVQLARTTDGRSVAQTVVDGVAQLNQGVQPLGSMGLVIGATAGQLGGDGHSSGDAHAQAIEERLELGTLNGPVLAPGMGTQGGTTEDLRRLFAGLTGRVLPSYSREILAHGPSRTALRAAAEKVGESCQIALQSAGM
jgi:orotidine-5'-phosphate decarboxylase